MRINATFTEASAAGDFLAMWSVFELIIAARSGRDGGRHWWYTLAGSFMVVNTTSTTGYIALAVAWTIFISNTVVKSLGKGRIALRAVLAALVSLGAVIAAFVFGGHSASLVDAIVVNKLQSGSAVHRLASMRHAIGVFTQSFGLGVGLGSDRAMSAGAYILANLGVIGFVLFPYLLWQLYAIGRSVIHFAPTKSRERIWLEALGWALAVQIVAMLKSGAEITAPTLWIPWAMLAATLRRSWLEFARVSRTSNVGAVPAPA